VTESLRAIRRIIVASRPSIVWAVAAASSLVLASAIGVLPPIFTGRIIDALQRSDANATLRQLAAYAGITILSAILAFGNTYATAAFREGIARNLRVKLMEKVLHARLCALEQLSFGEVANRLSEDLESLCARFEYALFPMLSATCQLAATLVAMFAIDRRFAAISCVAVALSVLPARLIAGRFIDLQRGEASNHDARSGMVAENATLGGLALLRHPRAGQRQLERYAALADGARKLRLGMSLTGGIGGFATTLINLVGPIAVLALGAFLLLNHGTTVGTIVMFLLYQSRLYGPFSALSNLPLQVASCGIFAKRVLEIVDLEEESSGDVPFVDGDLVIDDVSVVRSDRTIVRGADVSIRAGSHVGFVGPSGAGKSTIGALMLRLHDTAGGSVRIGTRELREFDLRSLRDSVVAVPQDPLVFDASLWENLTYLNPSAGADEVARAVEICCLDEVVARLPERFDARLGQRGFRLSGGERQRVCVARALIAAPRTLILDEALTGVDVETETRIMRGILGAFRDRTVIVITHRLHAVVDLESIVVVEDGRVTAQGNHDEVTAASAWYREASEAARMSKELVFS
jgi:ABC-type multidrug transport system fused ATPase/permease subunit